MLGIVVYKHVVRDSQDMAVHIDGRRYDNLPEELKQNMSFSKFEGDNSTFW